METAQEMLRRLEKEAGSFDLKVKRKKTSEKSHVLQSEADTKVYTYDGFLPEVVEDFKYLGSLVPSTVWHQSKKSTGQEINDTLKTEIPMRRSFAGCKNR